jgi:uncharacterized membrane protein YtjA (UPF0391 family)
VKRLPPTAKARPIQRTLTFNKQERITTMLNWAITFLVIALIAAIFGFGILAGTAMEIARIIFFVFIVLFIISFFTGRKTPSA